MKRMRQSLQDRRRHRQGPRARGASRQIHARRSQRTVRRSAVAVARVQARRGTSHTAVAARLGMCPSTLRHWLREWRSKQLAARCLGRPARIASAAVRLAVLALLMKSSGRTGVPELRRLFPEVARGELAYVKQVFAKLVQGRHGHVLRWRLPGAVWALDGTKLDAPIDGCWERLLVLRDLASGMTLAAWPAMAEDSVTTQLVLEHAIAVHGPPLVLKTDNGSGFRSHDVEMLMAREAVLHLPSPPYTPSYNGSCEAGVGSITCRLWESAARQGRPGEPTCDDVEAARQQANQVLTRAGHTRQQTWDDRVPIDAGLRSALWRAYHDHLRRLRETHRSDDHDQRTLDAWDRSAIRSALCDTAVLEIRRR